MVSAETPVHKIGVVSVERASGGESRPVREIKSGATIAADWFNPLDRVANVLPSITSRAVVHGGAEQQSRRKADVVPLSGLGALLERLERGATGPPAGIRS